MITNPIIPVWIMVLICIALVILVIYDENFKNKILKSKTKEKTIRQKKVIKNKIINIALKISMIILLFVMNLRFMLPNGESMQMKSDMKILFVIDRSVSMKALDYDGNNERIKGVINDCCYIVDELSTCNFSIITFGDEAKRLIPFTSDTDLVQSELKAIITEDDEYAKGSEFDSVKDTLEKTLKEESEKNEGNSKIVVFFITDGEITVEGKKLKSFANMSQYISNGAVLGYGTKSGGKMVRSAYVDDPDNEFYYLTYFDNYEPKVAISKIDETNLKKISEDLKIDYIQMSKTSNINYKISDIKKQISNSQSKEEKITSYQDIYYYFAIVLVLLFTINFVLQKRRME